MKLPSRKKILGACLLSAPFVALFVKTGCEYGFPFALGWFAGLVALFGCTYHGIMLLTSDD